MVKNKSPAKKSKASALDKLIDAALKKKTRDTVEKGRALKRLGIYNPKQLTQKSLTLSQRKTIEKKFKELQREKFYTRGVSHSPLTQDSSGRYKLSEYFSLVRTKKKVADQKAGVVRTGKGLLVSHTGDTKVRIDKKGRLIEVSKAKGTTRRFRKIRNTDLMAFLEKGARGELQGKYPRGTRFLLHRWGGTNGSHLMELNPNIVQSFAEVYKYEIEFKTRLKPRGKDQYSQLTYIEQVTYKDLD